MAAIKLYLASTSPRRHELLRAAGIAFELVAPGDEPEGHGTPLELAQQRARAKAEGAVVAGPTGWVLGVDTVVERDGREYGKAETRDAARQILTALLGGDHVVHTAHCLVSYPPGHRLEAVARATVHGRRPTAAELEAYLDTDAWRGKAGSYGLQDAAADFVTLRAGDFDTVVGLSLRTLRRLLVRAAASVRGSR